MKTLLAGRIDGAAGKLDNSTFVVDEPAVITSGVIVNDGKFDDVITI